jgi:uncharacterized protein (TIGR03118 family)
MSTVKIAPLGRAVVKIAPLALVRVTVAIGLMAFAHTALAGPVSVTNLITDDQMANAALLTDPNLVNAWGVSFPPTGPLWVSAADRSRSMIYGIDPVTNFPTKIPFEVTVPGNPTGQVFNGNMSAFNGDAFIFASEDGSISGWRGALGTTAEVLQSASPDNGYKGLASAEVGGHTYLYAADFHGGQIDILKGDAAAPDLTGQFVDPNLPAGYAPFNVQTIGDKVYVTYALQDAAKDEEVPGVGFGFVNVFDTQGNLIDRIGSDGLLNSPWGLAVAPSSFGQFAGDLFVGNFGDGRINIFDLGSNMFVDLLRDINGNPIAIDGLWALTLGNGGLAGSEQSLYFTAGPDEESHGLVGVISPVPEPATLTLFSSGLAALIARRRRYHA